MPRRPSRVLFAMARCAVAKPGFISLTLLSVAFLGFVSAQVVQVVSSGSTGTIFSGISNGWGWGQGGKPKPTPTPAPPPGPVIDPDGTWTKNANGNSSDTANRSGGIVTPHVGSPNFTTLKISPNFNLQIAQH